MNPVQIDFFSSSAREVSKQTRSASPPRFQPGESRSSRGARSNDAAVQTRLTAIDEQTAAPYLQFADKEMANPRYTILVFHYLLGPYRIKISDRTQPDPGAPAGHGAIVQEMCTYRGPKLSDVIAQLRRSKEPVELARSWVRPNDSTDQTIRFFQPVAA